MTTSAIDHQVEPRMASTRASVVRKQRRGSSFDRSRNRLFIPFVGPAFGLYALFLLVPIGATAWISLHRWPGAGPMAWRGLDNYWRLFQDPLFQTSFVNMLILLFLGGIGTFAFSFLLMLILRNLPGRKFARAVIFFPTIVPTIALSILWGFLFQSNGLVNALLRLVGVDSPPQWLAKENLFMMVVVGIIWTSTGFYTTILMAAVDRIPKDLYEDCALAGASKWQTFRHVTIPLSWEVIGVCAVLWTIAAVTTFEVLLVMAGAAGQMPPVETWTSSLYAYAVARPVGDIPSYGASAANSIVILLLVAVLVVGLLRFMRRDRVEY